MKHGLLFLWLLTLVACSKSDTEPDSTIVGTWRLSHYCEPNGTSTCTDVTVPTNKLVLVTFGRDGSFNEFYENTKAVDYAFLGCGSGTYQLEGDNVRIIAMCMSSSTGKLIPLMTVQDNLIVLKPFDIGEYTFVRVS